MGFIDELKESLTPRPDRNEPVCAPEPYAANPSRENIESGDNQVYLIRVPYPAEGSATVDFALQLLRPVRSIYYPVIMNPGTPLAAYAFTPQGINLSVPIPSTINNPLFDLTPGQLTRWKKPFSQIYISVNGYGTGGFITILVSESQEFISSATASTTDLHKLTTIETITPLAANGVFTGAWHDSQADGVLFVMASVFATIGSTANGFVIQESDDISNANFTRTIQVGNSVANTLGRIVAYIKCRYWRVVFTNSTSPQTAMEITTTASDILNQIGYPADTISVNVPVQPVAFNTTSGSIGDNSASSAYTPFTEISAGVTSGNPGEVFVPVYGGAFSGTPNAALQGWSRPRTPTVFKNVTTQTLGATPVWTPGAGNKFRLLGYLIEVSGDASLAAAGILTISLTDAAAVLPFLHRVYLPVAAPVAPSQVGYSTRPMQLGQFGVLSAAANNVLNVSLSAALTSGAVNVIAFGTEE